MVLNVTQKPSSCLPKLDLSWLVIGAFAASDLAKPNSSDLGINSSAI
jgi:hypothetical protein